MGLLEPHGGHRRRDGEADLIDAVLRDAVLRTAPQDEV